MKPIIFIFLILITISISAQKVVVNEYAAIDKKAIKIPDTITTTTTGIANFINTNFKTDKEKARAIFIWIASNIEYDVANMFAINFYATKEDKIEKALKTKKGICENYATLFNEIATGCSIKSFVIEGYTKQNGFADYIPHAWCAAYVDSAWYMFDPTWGSGYMNAGKFYKKINNAYFKTLPATLIKSHIPFDYLWQFLNYPITNQEFYEGKIMQNKTKPYFNYEDSIKLYETKNRIEQLVSAAYRIEKNGVKNAMVFDRLQHIKLELENDRLNTATNAYNIAVVHYNNAIRNINNFIQYRNKQFNPIMPDADIQHMMDVTATNITDAKNKLAEIKNPDAATTNLINYLTKSIEDINVNIKEQQEFLTLYFSKGKAKRKALFFEKKITWFGIPLN
jgi:hypothetical protein